MKAIIALFKRKIHVMNKMKNNIRKQWLMCLYDFPTMVNTLLLLIWLFECDAMFGDSTYDIILYCLDLCNKNELEYKAVVQKRHCVHCNIKKK